MRTPWIWSVSLGRWWGVHLRVHMLFFLFAAYAIHAAHFELGATQTWLGVSGAVVLFVSLLLHEIGHVAVARRLGGIADDIVIGPLGGLSGVRVPYEPHSELVAIMSGTLVNATICFVCAFSLVLMEPAEHWLDLLEPSISMPIVGSTASVLSSPVFQFLTLVFWINWSLILVNFLPVFPFDGGRSLHAALSFLWPEFDSGQSLTTICRLGKIFAAVFLLIACTQPSMLNVADGKTWFALAFLGIYIYFNSRREELQHAEHDQEEDTVFGYDFSQGYTSLERGLDEDEDIEADPELAVPPMGILGRWIEKRKESQRQREIEQEAEDERRVDEILARLHEQGMRSLSKEDRALLNRVSERYRSRQD